MNLLKTSILGYFLQRPHTRIISFRMKYLQGSYSAFCGQHCFVWSKQYMTLTYWVNVEFQPPRRTSLPIGYKVIPFHQKVYRALGDISLTFCLEGEKSGIAPPRSEEYRTSSPRQIISQSKQFTVFSQTSQLERSPRLP